MEVTSNGIEICECRSAGSDDGDCLFTLHYMRDIHGRMFGCFLLA